MYETALIDNAWAYLFCFKAEAADEIRQTERRSLVICEDEQVHASLLEIFVDKYMLTSHIRKWKTQKRTDIQYAPHPEERSRTERPRIVFIKKIKMQVHLSVRM